MSRLCLFLLLFLFIFFSPAHAQTPQLYLADYLEFSVFPKLAPESYQDRLKNAMIMRAGGQSSQTNYVCSPEETEKIEQLGINWLPNLPPFAPADYSQFYIPFIKNSYPDNTHQNTTKLPNSESIGCLIIYAQKFFNTLYGSHFIPEDIDKVINFAVNNNFNPSLFLAIWLEETHAGDRSVIELGCGAAEGFDAQLDCLENHMNPKLKSTPLFHCFLCGYAGDCTADLACGWVNSDEKINDKWTAFIQYYNYLTKPGSSSSGSGSSSSVSNSPPDAAAITQLYGFKPATIQIHDYEINTPLGKFKLSQLTPKPLDDPQALENWLTSTTAKIWAYVPMFTREDTKGFIEAPSGEVHQVLHPHIPRTFEVSSALLFLAPFQTAVAPPIDNSLPTVDNFLTGGGDVAQEGSFTTNNPTESPVKFKTYTPFLKEISDNLIGIYSKNSGIFNIFNVQGPFPPDIFALGANKNTSPNQSKFYYTFLGSDYSAAQQVQSFLQPFIGQNAQ